MGGYSHCFIDKNGIDFIENTPGINILTNEMINDIFDKAPELQWREIVKLLQEWYLAEKYKINNNRFFMSISGQRPIFIAYKLKKSKEQ
jgi:hypothetical protein